MKGYNKIILLLIFFIVMCPLIFYIMYYYALSTIISQLLQENIYYFIGLLIPSIWMIFYIFRETAKIPLKWKPEPLPKISFYIAIVYIPGMLLSYFLGSGIITSAPGLSFFAYYVGFSSVIAVWFGMMQLLLLNLISHKQRERLKQIIKGG